MSRTLTTIILLSVFTLLVASCQEEKIPIVAEPFAQKPTIAKPALDLIDLSKMPPLGPKRMQSNTGDALGNKNRVVEDLIANGKDSIPFLINQLDDETKMEPTIMEFWYQLSVGDMAYITLTDFFTDETELKSTTSGFSWDEFLERGSDKASMSEEILRRYIRKHGRMNIKKRWQKMWVENKENILWDEPCRCFRVSKTSK